MSSPPGNLHSTPFFVSSLRSRHYEFERALKSAHPALVSFLYAFQVQILDRSMLPEQGLSEIEGGVHHYLKGGGGGMERGSMWYIVKQGKPESMSFES